MSQSTPDAAARVGRRLALYFGLRHLRQRRSRLISSAAWAGLGSISLGVAAMCISMALMSGYTETLLEKMFLGGAVIVVPIGQPEDLEQLPQRLTERSDVAWVSRSLLVQGSLEAVGAAAGKSSVEVHLRGVEPGAPGILGAGKLGQPESDPGGRAAVRLGAALAERLAVDVGDRVRLVALDLAGGARFRYRTLQVTEIFATGFALFDREYAVMDLEELRRLTGGLPFFEVATTRPLQADRLRNELGTALGDDYLVRDWRQSSPGLFTALRLQKWALFLLLGLIVVVSTFNVAAALLVLVRERTREVGVLLALGTPPQVLRQSFLVSGLLIGGFGCLLGAGVGAAVAWTSSTFELLRFNPGVAEIYFVDKIPLRLRPTDVLAVVAFTMTVTAVGCWWPLRRVHRISPAAALRVE